MRGILNFFDFIFYRTYTFYTGKGETEIPGVYALCVITLFPLLNISSLSFILIDLINVKDWNYSKPLLLLCFLAVLLINYVRIFRQIGISNFLTKWKVIDDRKKKKGQELGLYIGLATIFVYGYQIAYVLELKEGNASGMFSSIYPIQVYIILLPIHVPETFFGCRAI